MTAEQMLQDIVLALREAVKHADRDKLARKLGVDVERMLKVGPQGVRNLLRLCDALGLRVQLTSASFPLRGAAGSEPPAAPMRESCIHCGAPLTQAEICELDELYDKWIKGQSRGWCFDCVLKARQLGHGPLYVCPTCMYHYHLRSPACDNPGSSGAVCHSPVPGEPVIRTCFKCAAVGAKPYTFADVWFSWLNDKVSDEDVENAYWLHAEGKVIYICPSCMAYGDYTPDVTEADLGK